MAGDRIQDLGNFFKELNRESDRGLALVGSAYIDEQLSEIIQSFSEKNMSNLLYGKSAALGSFSARIEICYALCLIDGEERSECDCIRKVRNEFAHKVAGTSFSEGKIRDLCSNLQMTFPSSDAPRPKNSRVEFLVSVVSMASRLMYRDILVKRERRIEKVWVNAEEHRWRVTRDEPPPEGVSVIGLWAQGRGAVHRSTSPSRAASASPVDSMSASPPKRDEPEAKD